MSLAIQSTFNLVPRLNFFLDKFSWHGIHDKTKIIYSSFLNIQYKLNIFNQFNLFLKIKIFQSNRRNKNKNKGFRSRLSPIWLRA